MSKCQVCDDLGVVTRDVPLGHPDFGKSFPCPACSTYEERRLQNIIQMSHLEAHQDKTFTTFVSNIQHFTETENAQLRAALSRCMNFATNPSGWLLLHGPCGTGKTHLAAAIAHEFVSKGIRAVFMTVPDLLDHLRAGYAPYSQTPYDQQFDLLCKIPLLVLDDLGSESPTAWAQEKLYQLINTRYTAKLPTVITTNLDIAKLEERLASRITDIALVEQVILNLPDYRREGGSLSDPILKDLSRLSLLKDKTLDSFNFDHTGEKLQKVIEVAPDRLRRSQWVILMGHNGTGKTHLAAALTQAWMSKGSGEGLMVSTLDLLDFLKSSFDPRADSNLESRFKSIRRIGLLTLDDFNISSKTPEWSRDKLFQMLDYRYVAKLPTIITLKPGQINYLEQHEPDFYSRFADRSYVHWIILDVPDYRSKVPSANVTNIQNYGKRRKDDLDDSTF